jgi:hypothetical protein
MDETEIPLRSKDADPDDRVDAVREELSEFHTDIVMQREDTALRAGRIVASVELSTYREVADHLRSQGLVDLADHYAAKADRAEVQCSLKGHE